ncbi:MAG TPA: hypothetical protein VLS25_07925 [Dehalococcoidia bacterium]|nr:hypothetical protein [Dehalococcoidia bacterium]
MPGVTPDDVTSFFVKRLPSGGWQEEGPPATQSGEKEGSVSKTVMYTFLKGDLRLYIQIPLTHKDAPDGVVNVNLILAPKNVQLNGSPVGTPVDWTPLPAPVVVTPTYVP